MTQDNTNKIIKQITEAYYKMIEDRGLNINDYEPSVTWNYNESKPGQDKVTFIISAIPKVLCK